MRRVLIAVVVLWCAGVLVACGGSPAPDGGPVTPAGSPIAGGLPVGSSVHTLAVGGRNRLFRVYRPASLPAGPVPLVVMIHGGGGSARGAEDRYGWDPEADRGRFLVAYPDGVGHSWNGGDGPPGADGVELRTLSVSNGTPLTHPGGGGCCGVAGRDGVDDVGFIGAMVASIEATTPIDTRRIDATGISEGGIMAYRLACSTRTFAAIGPDSATRLGPCAAPAPISLIHIHGTADGRIPIDGRPGFGPNHITGGPIDAVVAGWRTVDRCPPPTTSIAGPVHTTAASCPDGRAVVLTVIDGAGHQWPGGVPPAPGRRSVADPPSTALDATDTIWGFFVAHPRS